MARNLLIVESPSKAKTLKKYLGKDFEVLASYGLVKPEPWGGFWTDEGLHLLDED